MGNRKAPNPPPAPGTVRPQPPPAPPAHADSAETILAAALELHEAITDTKAKLLMSMEAALKVGYHMRAAQRAYYSARTGKQQLLIEAKRLESAFDRRLAEIRAEGVDIEK